MWFNIDGGQIEKLDDYLEGNPFDRNLLLGLVVTGLTIVIKRWSKCINLVKNNKFFLIFFMFCGISCLWSDYAFTAFKRYIKDIGNLIMALIILTETNAGQALKAILSRYMYILVLFSVLFIYYFPEYGRVYNHSTGEPMYCGIATEKNIFGQFVFLCGLFIVWELIEILIKKNGVREKFDLFSRYILLALIIWLLYMIHSTTSTLCMILGSGILILMQTSLFKKQINNLGIWIIVFLLFIVIIYSTPGFLEIFTGILGKDATLTGRTDIWQELLTIPINPLLGTGYQSFWQTPAAALIGERFYFIPNQAHNGFLEVYIQTGLISLFLLLAAIIAASRQIKEGLLMDSHLANLLFPFFIISLVSNWTEASINKFTLVWFIMMIAILYKPSINEYGLGKNSF